MNSPAIQSMLNRLRYSWLPPAKVGICRIRHDRECSRLRGPGRYPYLSRFYDPKATLYGLPETVRFNGGKRGNITLESQWQWFFAEENSPRAQKYLKRLQSGWVNYGPFPKVEQLCTASPAGTFVVVTHIDSDRAYIESYDNGKAPSDYSGQDYRQLFGVVYSDDSIGYPDLGYAYTFAIHNPGESLWVDTRDLTFYRS